MVIQDISDKTNENGLQKTQEAVEEVKVIMLNNYDKATGRDEKLSYLDLRAEELRESGKVFQKTTRSMMEQKKKEHVRLRCINKRTLVIAVIVLVLVIIGVCIAFAIGQQWQGDQEVLPRKENGTTTQNHSLKNQ
ncbi:hypothetical protein NL108_011096 [Boleophthalmus pectinirostris]|nr:hypothetical protein NL108_011096 [Boleophthalmus pectinirostris]